jgi:sulfite exporter TauE/SafE
MILLPWVAFLTGLVGSPHCVAMCGGLVISTTNSKKSVLIYQFGRLFGYLTLGAIAGLVGNLFNMDKLPRAFTLIPALMMGLIMIFLGYSTWKKRKAELPLPKSFRKLYNMVPTGNSFLVGSMSIFLPCGLLYGALIAAASFHNFWIGLLCMFFFWVGTMPAMTLGPELFRRLFEGVFKGSERIIGVLFIIIGVATIGFRIYSFILGKDCH